MDNLRKTDLTTFNNAWFRPGNPVKRGMWYITNVLFFTNRLFAFSGPKRSLLRMFGAKVGKGVVIKPAVNIKYPWKLRIGDYSWIGEDVWIDNLGDVVIGSHCCISQGAMLLCGNHDFKKSSFDLMVADITLGDGAWVGAKSVVCPGVELGSHAVLAVGSMATSNLDAYGIYQGNPATKIKERIISE